MSNIDPDAVLNCSDCYGTLTVNDVPMMNAFGAWCLPDLSPLWGDPDERGEDELLPGATGIRPLPHRETGTEHDVPFWCSGQVDGLTGLLAADLGRTVFGQLAVNMAYLRTEVFSPTGTGDGTRPIEWEVPAIGTIITDGRLRLPASSVALLPKGVLRATAIIHDPLAELHL